MKKLILTTAAVMMLSTPVMAEIMCRTTTQMVCNQEGCESGNPVVWRVLDIDNLQIHRCDNSGCDSIDIVHSNKSIDYGITYLNFSFGGGAVLRMDISTWKFVEMATLGLDSYISHGKCVSQ